MKLIKTLYSLITGEHISDTSVSLYKNDFVNQDNLEAVIAKLPETDIFDNEIVGVKWTPAPSYTKEDIIDNVLVLWKETGVSVYDLVVQGEASKVLSGELEECSIIDLAVLEECSLEGILELSKDLGINPEHNSEDYLRPISYELDLPVFS